MYWIMLSERSDEYEYSHDDTPPQIETNGWEFDMGELVTETIPLIDVPITPHVEERLTDNIPAYGCNGLLINKRVKQIFEQNGVDNIQYFPARVVNVTQQNTVLEYWIANVIGKIEFIDQEKSDVDYDEKGEIEFINSLVLKPSKNHEYGHFFRLAEFPPVLVVSDFLKKALTGASITGLMFYKPEDFSL